MAFAARGIPLFCAAISMLIGLGDTARAQAASPENGNTALPSIEVVSPRRAQQPRRPRTRVTGGLRRESPASRPQTEAQVVAGNNENSTRSAA